VEGGKEAVKNSDIQLDAKIRPSRLQLGEEPHRSRRDSIKIGESTMSDKPPDEQSSDLQVRFLLYK